jgi:hypothetical protein
VDTRTHSAQYPHRGNASRFSHCFEQYNFPTSAKCRQPSQAHFFRPRFEVTSSALLYPHLIWSGWVVVVTTSRHAVRACLGNAIRRQTAPRSAPRKGSSTMGTVYTAQVYPACGFDYGLRCPKSRWKSGSARSANFHYSQPSFPNLTGIRGLPGLIRIGLAKLWQNFRRTEPNAPVLSNIPVWLTVPESVPFAAFRPYRAPYRRPSSRP